MLILQNVSYTFPNKSIAFEQIQFTLAHQEKASLVGHNGVGKSTLLQLINGEIAPTTGEVATPGTIYCVPQLFGQYNELTIAETLGVSEKITALKNILNGSVDENDYNVLQDDWTIEERCHQSLSLWGLESLNLEQKMKELSGGQKTKVFLAGIEIHNPDLILMDEPSNHLDDSSRQKLYNYISNCTKTLLVVSHDRQLLSQLDLTFEMNKRGVKRYGGNYDFYLEQKEIETQALSEDIDSKEKAIKKAKLKERETSERQIRMDNRGQKKQLKAGVSRIMMNTLRNKAENSTSRLKSVHESKIADLNQELTTLRQSKPDLDKMKFDFQNVKVHEQKILFEAKDIQLIKPDGNGLWSNKLNFRIRAGQRIAIQGENGSGKTSLLKVILQQLKPAEGHCISSFFNPIYIDQEYSLLDNRLTVFEQAQQFNNSGLQPAEVNTRLKRFLFDPDEWHKNVGVLSGGERLRLVLCCLTLNATAPDLIILDEPTNNLDLHNIQILSNAINAYKGTLLVVSHDKLFLKEVQINENLQL